MQDERRRYRRYRVQDLEGSLLFQGIAEVVNMSIGGLAVESPDRVDPGREYSLTLMQNGEEIQVRGQTVWCRAISTRATPEGSVLPVYRAGFEFEGALSPQANHVAAFIQQRGIFERDERLTVRLLPDSRTPVELTCEYEFLVRHLSLSGMRIETALEPQSDDIYDMRIHLPTSPLGVKGRVVHVEQPRAAGKYSRSQLGIEFFQISADAVSALQSYISQASR